MRPTTWVLATPAGNAWRKPAAPVGSCFIGLPADSGTVDGAWLRPVLRALLLKHEKVMVLLASELLAYEGHPFPGGIGVHGHEPMQDRVSADTMARWLEVEEVRYGLPSADLSRTLIASWAHFTDARFAAIWRQLLSALAGERRFRRDVLGLARASRNPAGAPIGFAGAASHALSCLEALAMRLRVSEVAGYHHEYGFGDDDVLANRLYAGAYAPERLTVESLVGHPARRVYGTL